MRKTFQQKIAMMEQTLSPKNLQWYPLANKKRTAIALVCPLFGLYVLCPFALGNQLQQSCWLFCTKHRL